MQFRDHEYYYASQERMAQAQHLYSQGDAYALAMYSAGLAVECLLRAFRWRNDRSFEGRHDLNDLLKASGILGVDENHMRQRGKDADDILSASQEFRANMNEIVVLWNNAFRFASEAKLAAHLKRIGRVQGVKGDPRKKNAADLIDAADFILRRGMVLWSSKTKS